MVAESVPRPVEAHIRLSEALVTKLRRRQIVGSRNVALATATLIQNIVRGVKYSTIDELLNLIQQVGKKLVEANPKELAVGNIIRRILRLIREEYRAAAAAHLSAPSSTPGTPYLGPETPGLHVPSSHYLSNGFQFNNNNNASTTMSTNHFGSTSTISSPQSGLNRQTSLSNFVVMRHSRAQLERSGSILDLSASTSSLFTPLSASGGGGKSTTTPTRGLSFEGLPSLRMDSSGFFSGSGSIPETTTGSPGLVEENSKLNYQHQQQVQQQQLLQEAVKEREDFMRQSGKLKPVLIQAIEEVVNELETTHEDVARGAREHIHSSETILTMGHSKTVEAFLKQAYKDRKFTVVVAESAPSYLGHSMATSLSSHGIPTLLIPDSSIHAIMPRITKVLLGAHSVLANGGLFALSGSLVCTLAARAHAKPVVITTGQFKFAPAWNLYNDYAAVDFQGPGVVLGYDGSGGGGGVEGVEVVDPYYDYIRPDLVNLFVTNEGDHSPSYIYRIIKEAYDEEDIEL